jgi:hypothetical protein
LKSARWISVVVDGETGCDTARAVPLEAFVGGVHRVGPVMHPTRRLP